MGTIVCYLFKMTVEKTLAIQLSYISNRLLAIIFLFKDLGIRILMLTTNQIALLYKMAVVHQGTCNIGDYNSDLLKYYQNTPVESNYLSSELQK